jgi:hypothetical protein
MRYGRMYSGGYVATTASTAAGKEIAHILSGSSAVTVLHEVVIGVRSSDSQMACFSICHAGTTGAPGSTVAVSPLQIGDAAFGGAVYAVAATNATGLTYIHRETVNQLNGFHYLPPPELRPIIKPSGHIVIRRETSVVGSTDIAYDINCVFEEIG